MPDPTDFEVLRTAVHEVCREANKGIFNHLEGVLLRLVDAIEAVSDAGHEHNPEVAKWIAAASTERRELRTGVSVQGSDVTVRTLGRGATGPRSTERRERDG